MNRENKVFANKINKELKNNKDYFYSNQNERLEPVKVSTYTKSISQKINEIFNSKSYIYKADVIITTKTGDFKKRIVGKNSSNIITSDNELIPISDIIDIRYQ